MDNTPRLTADDLNRAAETIREAFRVISEVIRPVVEWVQKLIHRIYHGLVRHGFIRVYAPPRPVQHGGRRRSQRELVQIRQQRKRQPRGLWLRDFTAIRQLR
ncbi:MAG TPA: hypothetical protein PKD09_09420 [Aggregatilinea sp.]|uniref:hypothetical protein n=1 Tax=Aggregatilinea sp. TaxID=2806333 RepID=UPI002C547B9F|nr:hypothetical protein [Aggregatilinea sp.]HML21856.1 hypothetical protein [Aggregatilinea sp.]